MKNTFRLQSAMEYLMTYGWAILIIAVVLGTLYQLGVFNSSSLSVRIPPGACKVLRTSAAVNLVGQCSGILPKYVAQFDGKTSYVNIGNAANLHPTGGITITAWIYQESTTASSYQMQAIGNYGVGGSYIGYALRVGMAEVSPLFGNGVNNWQSFDTANYYSLNSWHQVAMTYAANGNGCAYTDGTQTQCIAVGSLNPDVDTKYIGACATGYCFNGLISNVQIYNASLDASSISTLYQEGIGGAPVSLQYLVGWWPLNGDTKDYGGNNNGAPTAITYVSQYGK